MEILLPCGVALAYGIAFIFASAFYDSSLRKLMHSRRKRVRNVMILAFVHSILLLALMCWLPLYVRYIIPLAICLPLALYRIACVDKGAADSWKKRKK